MKKEIAITYFVEIEIPDEKIEDMVEEYKKCFDPEATIEDIFEVIAINEIDEFSGGGFCEGVGEPGEDFYILSKELVSLEEITGED
jgi:hypothetical protein